MIDILKNVMNIAGRVHDMQIAGTLSMVIFGVVLVFGIMNCVLGYRLLRFWMMIFGFLIGAGIGLFAVYQIGLGEKLYYAVGMIGVGCDPWQSFPLRCLKLVFLLWVLESG